MKSENPKDGTGASSPMLDLQSILYVPEGKVSTEFSMDLSSLEFFGSKPIVEPVTVTASVTNHAGALQLHGQVSTVLSACCDRCNTLFTQEKTVVLDNLVADSLEDEENEDILLLDQGQLPLGDIATTAFILAMDTKTLCSEACRGLCPQCGSNLNEQACTCTPDNDSPFAALASLLDD